MYIKEPSPGKLFKYLVTQFNVRALNVCLNLFMMKRRTNIALILWLLPIGTISSKSLRNSFFIKEIKPWNEDDISNGAGYRIT